MGYTLLQANTHPDDLDDAIRLLDPGWTGGQAIDHSDFWVTAPMPESAATVLAPQLAPMLGKRVVVVSVADAGAETDDSCRLWLAQPGSSPDDPPVGPIDGRDPALVSTLASAFFKRDGDELTAALTARKPPAERHRDVAKLLGLPRPDLESLHRQPGVVVVWAPPNDVRSRLVVDGHGAWLLPWDRDITLVVPDGTGWAPRAGTFAGAVERAGDRTVPWVAVGWGEQARLWGRGKSGKVELKLDEQEPKRGESAAAALAKLLGRPELEAPARQALSPGQPARRGSQVLHSLGIEGVPEGATVEQLAAWAAEQDGAVQLPARPGTSLAARRPDVAEVITRFRRRRTIRRVRLACGVVEFAAWWGLVWVVLDGPWILAVPVGVLIAGMILARMGLKRMLPQPRK
ncbi:hypothetical protein [Flindersiella endophytica]